MIGGEWFALHRSKGCEDGLVQLSANPVFILRRKVLRFREDAAWMRASDTARSDFSVRVDGSSAKLQWIKIVVSFDLSRTGWKYISQKNGTCRESWCSSSWLLDPELLIIEDKTGNKSTDRVFLGMAKIGTWGHYFIRSYTWFQRHSKSSIRRIACAFQVLLDGFIPLDMKETSFTDKDHYFIWFKYDNKTVKNPSCCFPS